MTVLFLVESEGLCSMEVLKMHTLLSMNSSGNVRCKHALLPVDLFIWFSIRFGKKVQVDNDKEMAQSERNSHSINRGVGKN